MTRPTEPGWWWARHITKAPGTADMGDPPSGEPEIVEVFENHLGPADDESFGVFVVGYNRMQWLENFEWLKPVPPYKEDDV